ncbi:RNA polymerase sigma factor [Polyangium sp. 15x6]|uniref:RNA polymerase sigma factor n=1 Tax=Polyangium sp. 15x6 TaxID=3042687 RepID=UPI00249BCCD9|nr:RNA polymerase sigma factor [Polyangium sp. 15x6]MDI3283436.1 RNA polymerase sigma factor [Polyangium sp. 15x6]
MAGRSFVERLVAELPALFRMARKMTRSETDAEDLVQSTVVRAMEKRGDLRDEERMRAWLFQVQRTVLLNGVRGAARRFEVIQGGKGREAPEPSEDLEEEILRRSFDDRVTHALDAMPPEWKEALLLREVEELSYEEIASVQGSPVGTVRSRLARARAALFEGLSEANPESAVHHGKM